MTSQSEQHQRAEFPAASPRGSEASPSEDQRALIRLLAEQHAIPLDQLARFVDRPIAEARRAIDSLDRAGLVERKRFLVGDEEWYWLTARGMGASKTGFTAYEPKVATLRHRRAVNAVRLHLAEHAPQGRWVPIGEVARELRGEEFLPDAAFEIDGERHAIEVELSRKNHAKLRRILAAHTKRWDAVVYFCARSTRSLLQQMRDEGRWTRLVVRRLPRRALSRAGGDPVSPSDLRWACDLVRGRGKLAPRRPAEPAERELLRLVAEQYALPFDQLARFRGLEEAEVSRLANRLVRAGFAEHGRFLVDEPRWLWLTLRGASRSGLDVPRYVPTPGALARLRALNEVRLHVGVRAPEARWVSDRVLSRECGHLGGHVPNAALELGGERHAIEVELISKAKLRAARILDAHSARYDAVVLFCHPLTRRFFERLNRGGRWPKLVIRDLPDTRGGRLWHAR